MAQPLSIIRAASKADGILSRLASESRGIRAFHGSPHKFDRFDASKIGTGEGAQAYGHGLYFAGNEGVARSYRGIAPAVQTAQSRAIAQRIQEMRSRKDQLLAELEEAVNRSGELGWAGIPTAPPEVWSRLQPQIDQSQNEIDMLLWEQLDSNGPGHMYEVELGVPEESLLDYDRPFSTPAGVVGAEVLRQDNPVAVDADTLRAIQDGSWKWESFRGRSPYQTAAVELTRLAKTRGGAQALREAGIPGLRYFDGNSRSAGEGTRNYVMFPGTEDRIRILRQYGLLPPLLGAAAMEEEQ